MNSPHDIGGMQRLGPVTVETDEPVFHAGWERTVLGLMLALAGQGHFNADQFRGARETVPPAEYLVSRYFELWLHAVERLMAQAVSSAEIDARVELLRAGHTAARPAGDPALAGRLLGQLRAGHSTAGDAGTPRRYAVGDQVRTRTTHPESHTRLPRYARGKRGVVEAVYPAFPLPDRVAQGLDPRPEHLYCVRFPAEELWGDSAEPGCEVHLDLWETYLHAGGTADER